MENVKMSTNAKNEQVCRIEVTVPTGFEQVAGGEVQEKIGSNFIEYAGKISFECPIDKVEMVYCSSVDSRY